MLSRLVLSLIWFLALALASPLAAQVDRYELGKRLQRFERIWQAASETDRANSTPLMAQAVQSFFSGQFRQAARQIDEARLAMTEVQAGKLAQTTAAWSCQILPAATASGPSAVAVVLRPYYDADPLPRSTTVKVSLTNWEDLTRINLEKRSLSEIVGSGWNWQPGELKAGDYQVAAVLEIDGRSWFLPESTFSVIDRFQDRLSELATALQNQRGSLNPTLFYTVRDQLELLQAIQRGEVQEIDYPAYRILNLIEKLLANPNGANELIGKQAGETDLWLTLAVNRKRVPVRLRAPRQGEASLPVLFLHHGAGGSENMFFETCGAGGCVKLALERGWLAVAPRQGLAGLPLSCDEMLDELEEIFPIDRSQVFLAGHSMGGAQVVRQVSLSPGLARGAAVLGGGGRTQDYETLAETPWFIAAGEMDFGRPGARQLSERLSRAGATVQYQEFTNVEHMVIVQAATEELFRFFDQQLNR